MVYESKHFPKDLKDRIYKWLKDTQGAERKADQTEEQFLYSTRKKALGAFKKDIMGLPAATRDAIAKEIEARFEFLFEKLNAGRNKDTVLKYTPFKKVITRKSKEIPKDVEISHEGAD
jgi:hypothetical protein